MIVDASVGVEIVRKTPLGQRAIQLLDDNLHAPDIFLAEVFHVLKRMTVLRQITSRDAKISAALVGQMPLTFLTVSNYQSPVFVLQFPVSILRSPFSMPHALSLLHSQQPNSIFRINFIDHFSWQL